MGVNTPAPRVVVCGSFHRDVEGLTKLFRELESHGCQILSPRSLNFTDKNAKFVRSPYEADINLHDIERWHLTAVRQADFVWLHNPEGYIGLSASMEIGFALAFGKPVFARTSCNEEIFKSFITVTSSVFEALEKLEQ